MEVVLPTLVGTWRVGFLVVGVGKGWKRHPGFGSGKALPVHLYVFSCIPPRLSEKTKASYAHRPCHLHVVLPLALLRIRPTQEESSTLEAQQLLVGADPFLKNRLDRATEKLATMRSPINLDPLNNEAR